MSLARKLKLRDQYTTLPPRATSRALLPAPVPCLALPAPPTTTPATSTLATITVEGRPVKHLTQAEHEERCCLGLCYHYNEKFDHGHNKVCQCLFLLDSAVEDEVSTETPEEGTIEELIRHFSLHAIVGVRIHETMQIHLKLGDTSLVALLDSGSTHNFISEAAAQWMGLPLQHHPRMTATLANGERVSPERHSPHRIHRQWRRLPRRPLRPSPR